MKLCIDCRYFGPEFHCLHPVAEVVSPVTGTAEQFLCEIQRKYDNLPDSCGQEARFFELKGNEAH